MKLRYDRETEVKKALELRSEAQALLDLAEFFRQYRWKDGRKSAQIFCQAKTFEIHFEPILDAIFDWGIEEEQRARMFLSDAIMQKLPSCHGCKCEDKEMREWLVNSYHETFEMHYDLTKSTEGKRAEFERLKKKPEFHSFLLIRLKAQNFLCYYCDEHINNTYHIDHRLPLSKGGSNAISNLVISCAACNLRKNDKVEEEFSLDPEYVNWLSLQYKGDIWMPVLTT
jgi:hypothetical protein